MFNDVVTSNLAFAQWTSVFGEASLTAALLDRLTHHGTIHEFGWESIRFTDSLLGCSIGRGNIQPLLETRTNWTPRSRTIKGNRSCR
jgi:hypothetical protein